MNSIINNIKIWKNIFIFKKEWEKIKGSIKSLDNPSPINRRVTIITCDPWSFSGSKGDEAMIQAIMDQLRTENSTIQFGTITATNSASNAAKMMGIMPDQVWDDGLTAIIRSMQEFNPDAVAIIGADCMDGYYSPYTTIKLIAIADIAARIGYKTTITGFSFNKNPIKQLRSAFNALSPKLKINVRDPISYYRFKKFSNVQCELVTDAAFMLNPATSSTNIDLAKNWAQKNRANGNTVLGFNIHPMLIKNATKSQINELINEATNTLERALSSKSHPLACALISHDYRGDDGDDRCLQEIYDNLKCTYSDRIFYRTSKLTAAELKAMAGLMDILITGRMHLAIAALGMCVPVAVITYQDKFQGLLEHFSFPDNLHINPSQISDNGELDTLLDYLIKNKADLKSNIQKQLSRVKNLSEKNISNILLSKTNEV